MQWIFKTYLAKKDYIPYIILQHDTLNQVA
jgi:hypothetical protein